LGIVDPTGATLPEPAAPPALIETIRREAGGAMPLLEHHLRRLERSCLDLSYTWPGRDQIAHTLADVADPLDASRQWRLRLLLAADGTARVEHGPLYPLPLPLHVVAGGPRPAGAESWLLHKTTHRPWYEAASTWLARRRDVFDVVYWNAADEMCEGSRCNIYMLDRAGRWLTPPLSAGALPGVQRTVLLQAGQAHEARITREMFLSARAWRISNALRGWCDAVLKPTPAGL